MDKSKYLTGASIGGLGLALFAVHALHLVTHEMSLGMTLIGAGVPIAASTMVIYAGYWTARQAFRAPYNWQLLRWTLFGTVAMGGLVGTITVHQYLDGQLPADAPVQLATALTGGALGGVLLGTNYVQLQRRTDRIESLQRATTAFVEQTSKRDVCQKVVEIAATEFTVSFVGAWLYDEEADALEPVAASKASREAFDDPPTYERGNSLSWDAFETGEMRVYEELHDQPNRYEDETLVRSEFIIPLGSHGVLNIASTKSNAFDDVAVATGRLLATVTEAVLDRIEREEELRAQQAALERQNQQLDEFASIVSHDLRNPLSVAAGYLNLAKDDCESPTLDQVETAHERMETLIAELLHLARAGQLIEDTTRVQLETAASDAWEMVQTEDAALVIAMDSRLIEADPNRLRQVFENLFRNAIEHGGGTVTVGALDTTRGFYVEDDGPGIPAEDRDRVFELGYTTREGGTGLGLVTVRRVAKAHGWSVTATESANGGARFEFVTEPLE